MSEQTPGTAPTPTPESTPPAASSESAANQRPAGRQQRKRRDDKPNARVTEPRSFDLDVPLETWDRLQARLRFKFAVTLAWVGVGLMIAAGVTWTLHLGQSSESTTVTTVVKGGVEESRTTVSQSASPFVGLSVGLAVLGLVALAPSVTWAIAPGSKIGAGGLTAEGSPQSQPTGLVQKSIGKTDENVIPMVETTSNLVDQPTLPIL